MPRPEIVQCNQVVPDIWKSNFDTETKQMRNQSYIYLNNNLSPDKNISCATTKMSTLSLCNIFCRQDE